MLIYNHPGDNSWARDCQYYGLLYTKCMYVQTLSSQFQPGIHTSRGISSCSKKVHRRVTRMPASLKDLDYETRKDVMGLTSLETRRLRRDLIQFFKIVKWLDYINWHSNLIWSEPRADERVQLKREINTTSTRHNKKIISTWSFLYRNIPFSLHGT